MVIRLQLDEVVAVLVSAAVVLREQIYEFAGASISVDGSTVEHDGARFSKVTQRVVVPLVAHDQHTGLIGPQNSPIAQLISGHSLRIRILRSIQLSSDCGSRRCASMLTR
jgi:hypothetical protein